MSLYSRFSWHSSHLISVQRLLFMPTWIDRSMQSKHIEGVCVHFEVTKSGKESVALMSLQTIHSRLSIALVVVASLSSDSGRSTYGLAEDEDEDEAAAAAAVLIIGRSWDGILS